MGTYVIIEIKVENQSINRVQKLSNLINLFTKKNLGNVSILLIRKVHT